MSSPTPPLTVDLQPSRLARAGLTTLGLLALAAALASERPGWQSLLLLSLLTALLWRTDRLARRRGCVQLRLQPDATGGLQVQACFADGGICTAPFAGWSQLGTLATFVFLQREDWRRVFGPRRIAVLRDATGADGFRRLRALLRTR